MMHRQVPKIKAEEDIIKNGYTLSANGYSQFITREELKRCWTDLGIPNSEMFFARFGEVCDWFIAQTQYIDFEELK